MHTRHKGLDVTIFLQLSQNKTEVLIIGTKVQREKLTPELNILGLNPSPAAKYLRIVFDLEFKFKAHVQNITKTAFYHLKNIAKIRPFLSLSNTEKLMHLSLAGLTIVMSSFQVYQGIQLINYN